MLKRHIVNHLVESPLQESGINRYNGNNTLRCQSGRECNRMPLRDSYVKTPVGQGVLQIIESGTVRHGGGNADYSRILLSYFNKSLAEYFRVTRF